MEKNYMELAPVIIPTLCRFEHFKRCVESLSRCTDADKTELYIGLDYPSKESHWKGYNQIKDYINTITGFKEVVVIRHEKNVGSAGNTRALKELIKNKYDRYIYSDDDEEFSPNFLQYINTCLNKYRDDENVMAICSYNIPLSDNEMLLSRYEKNAYPMHGYNAHAVGLWFNKRPQGITKDQLLKSFKLAYKAIWCNHAFAVRNAMLLRDKASQLPDVGRELFCVYNKKYCIFPTISKVRNWGFDGSGINCEILGDWVVNRDIDDNKTFVLDDFSIKDYPEIKKLERQIYGFSKWYLNVYLMVDYLFFRVAGHRLIESKIMRCLRKK